MEELINILEEGKLAVLPSDTVYGIFADATNIDAIKRVDEAKKSNKPHLVVVSSIEMMEKYVSEVNDLQRKIINKYWPNTLTILFKKNDLIDNELTKGSEYLGIRMPKNDYLLELLNKFNKPLISSSANLTGEKVITNVNMLDPELKNKISYIKDSGELSDIASTLIKVEDNKIIFLREGELAESIKKDFSDFI